jgi:hypothetical protein
LSIEEKFFGAMYLEELKKLWQWKRFIGSGWNSSEGEEVLQKKVGEHS